MVAKIEVREGGRERNLHLAASEDVAVLATNASYDLKGLMRLVLAGRQVGSTAPAVTSARVDHRSRQSYRRPRLRQFSDDRAADSRSRGSVEDRGLTTYWLQQVKR